MSKTRADVVVNGVSAKLYTDGDAQPYRRRTVRREIEQQLLTQAEAPTLRNRSDGVTLYQTSWAGGARWWKPLLTPQEISSYFQANHFDLWSEPGKVVPGNKHTDAANTDLHDNCIIGTDGTDWYAIGNDNTTDAAERSVYKWTPGSNAWVRETTYSSGIQDDSDPVDMAYDPTDGYFYVLAALSGGGWEMGRFHPGTPAHDLTWLDGSAGSDVRYGGSVAASEYGVFFSIGLDVSLVDKATPTHSAAFSPNHHEILSLPAGTEVVNTSPLLISTPQGLYLVRNQVQGGQPQAFVYRIDKDTSGTYIGNPIATLPLGSVALSATFHLGQLFVTTTPDYANLLDGEEDVEIVIYYVGEGGKGALGSVLGGRDEVDETPYRFLGTDGTKVYIAGSKRLWVWDAIRGGLHTAWEWETSQPNGGYMSMARAQDSDGDENMIFLAADRMNRVKIGQADDPDTVTSFGDDETHYTLESNYFDGGLPMDQKEITKVAIIRDKDDGGSEWTVQVAADDGAFADVLVDSGTGIHAEQTTSGVTGYQFRYKLIYQTKDTARKALRALLVTMATADMVTEWDLVLDGSQLLNLDNKVQNPEEFYDSMVTLGEQSTLVSFVDNYQEHGRLQDSSATSTKVKVVGVEIMKDTPGESVVSLRLREA